MSKDLLGREYVNLSDLSEGQIVWIDGGFTCHRPGQVTILIDENGPHFKCEAGNHYLDGQCDHKKMCIGVYPKYPGEMAWVYEGYENYEGEKNERVF